MASKPYREADDGLVIFIRLTPKSAKDTIEGCFVANDGVCRLKIRVRAQPDKGQANKSALKLLAKRLGLAQTSLTLTGGAKNRNKSVLANGDRDNIRRAVTDLME
jgi:uncharacterized protein